MGLESNLKDQHGATQLLLLRGITSGQHLTSMEFSRSRLIQGAPMPTKDGQLCGLLANALMGIQWWIQVMNLVDANPISPSLVARMLVKAQTEELYEMHEFRNFNFPLGDYEKKQPYSQQECRQSCLHSGNTCWMKRLPLGNGRQPKLTRLVPATPSLLETNLHSFTYETLEKATRGFSEEIGRGSSGVVYKGQLEAASCNLMIAIKRLDRLAQERDKEFRTELSAIGKTSHKNLVSKTDTMIRRGYVPPEWFKNVPVMVKVDVYSFGVMLEIIWCRSVLMMDSGEEEKAILTDWAYDCYIEGRNVDALVKNDEEAFSDSCRLHKWIKIALMRDSYL
ncbi:hypothetical protein JHK86_002405 [Glycine max]|nr:hypothetical protein JHK86_002405 [Glycine max]